LEIIIYLLSDPNLLLDEELSLKLYTAILKNRWLDKRNHKLMMLDDQVIIAYSLELYQSGQSG